MSKKYFINNLDTDFGNNLLQQLVKQPTQEPVHLCSIRGPMDSKPNGIKKILKREKPKLFTKKMIDQCEVYVYNINQTEISDIQFGINAMSKPFEQNKVFILVSDILAWSDSGKKIKKQEVKNINEDGEEGVGEGEAVQEKQKIPEQNKQEESVEPNQSGKDDQDNQNNEVVEKKQMPIEYTFFEDADYQLRKPLEKYSYIKEIEDKVLSIKRQNVKIFIVCPGLIYGCGEDSLYPLYRAAWLQEPKELPFLETGDNEIPMIHLKDLVKFVIKVAQNPPEGPPYLLAFDQNSKKTQKSIIESISKGIGSERVKQVSQSALFENVDRFLVKLDIRASKFLIGTPEEPSQFQWTAKQGISQNIHKTRQQFCSKHSLRPIKILILQNDPEWKDNSKIDYILKIFSNYYRIPVLDIKEILKNAVEEADEELKADLEQEWKNINEYIKANQKRKLDQTMKVFYRAIRWRLCRNDCANRGFILLNFPNFCEELQYIFLKTSPKKFKRIRPKVPIVKVEKKQPVQGEEAEQQQPPQEQKQEQKQEQEAEQEAQEQGQGPKYELSFPESIISIKKSGSPSVDDVIQFFTLKGVEQLIYDTTDAKQHQIFESLRSYIERNGKPNNYLEDDEDLLAKHLNFTKDQNTSSLTKRQQQIQAQKTKLKGIVDARHKLRDEIAEIVRTEGQQEIKKMPFRNYLMEFVVPTLNQGLLEVSNIIPNDPVDLLAEYLYQKSYDF